jgi:hypothetical protein
MAKQVLPERILETCRHLTGKPYRPPALHRGNWGSVAEIWYSDRDADRVNWETGAVEPYVRDGKWVGSHDTVEVAVSTEEIRRRKQAERPAYSDAGGDYLPDPSESQCR